MGTFKLGKMTLRSLVNKPETIMYPAEERFKPSGLRGHVECDIDACILCGICAKRCPTDSIKVDKKAGTWEIDRFDCIQCETCVRECPKNCLVMEKDYQKPAAKKAHAVYTKPEPSAEEKAAAEEAKKARIEAAMKAKAEREANKA
ncbi:MAG: 4Fe-4S dicluster domain-containing protein [Coriobacteriia bacterium]|nr:4Fe-4S dicluster domain-containing protein [Coriobacteriia bacterium]